MIPGRKKPSRNFAVRACAAAVCAVFSASTMAQSAAEQARTNAGQALITSAQSTGFLAGLDRALKTPLEVIWLRTASEASIWDEGSLSQATQACGNGARAQNGCVVVGRTAWRYVFGGNAQFAPQANEVARLIVSSLKLPESPLTSGKLELSGTGRLYLITPESTAPRKAHLAVVLAAGSVLTISDAAAPAIQIELKASETQPLLLGNLATAEVSRMLSLLLKPGAVNASEASVDAHGRVALRSSGEVQLAAIVPGSGRLDVQPATAIARAEPLTIASLVPAGLVAPVGIAGNAVHRAATALFSGQEFPGFTAAFQALGDSVATARTMVASLAPHSAPLVEPRSMSASARAVPMAPLGDPYTNTAAVLEAPARTTMLVASLAPSSTVEQKPTAGAPTAAVRSAVRASDDLTRAAAAIEAPARPTMLVASLVPAFTAQSRPAAGGASAATRIPVAATDDFTRVAASIEAPVKKPADAIVVASLAPAVQEKQIAARISGAAVQAPRATDEYTQVAAVALPQKSTPVAVAVAQPKPAAAATSADLARMRAEIEAEIERDNARMAAHRNAGGKRFILGV